MMPKLQGQVAVVTGASRGAGRAIAVVLGEAGATVYVSGRSTRAGPTTEGLPGTVEDTAEAVTARGGVGVAVRCDHTDDQQVETLFERVRGEQGRLDLVVNNAWGGYEHHDPAGFRKPFWEQPTRHWDGMFTAGLRAHLVASRCAVPLMLPRGRGLIVCTTAWDRDHYLGNLYYDVAKAAVKRLAWGMARELRPHGIAAVALAPGFMRTERVMAAHAQKPFDLGLTESPEYLGRAVVPASLLAPPAYGKDVLLADEGVLVLQHACQRPAPARPIRSDNALGVGGVQEHGRRPHRLLPAVEILLHLRVRLAVKHVVEGRVGMNLLVVNVQRREVEQLGIAARELERHRMHLVRLAALAPQEPAQQAQEPGRRPFQLEDGETVVAVRRQSLPDGTGDAETLVEPVEILDARDEGRLEGADLVDPERRLIERLDPATGGTKE
jgi:NAD(P)-dependent dehydrogenase (short-subunit alcohol dehydrogenase family)